MRDTGRDEPKNLKKGGKKKGGKKMKNELILLINIININLFF